MEEETKLNYTSQLHYFCNLNWVMFGSKLNKSLRCLLLPFEPNFNPLVAADATTTTTTTNIIAARIRLHM